MNCRCLDFESCPECHHDLGDGWLREDFDALEKERELIDRAERISKTGKSDIVRINRNDLSQMVALVRGYRFELGESAELDPQQAESVTP